MLAIGWYPSLPLPDAEAAKPPPAGPTELSARLASVFDSGQDCDVVFSIGEQQSTGEEIGAHRVVLRRNPHLGFNGTEPSSRRALPAKLSPWSVRHVLRAHYLEYSGSENACEAPRDALQEVRQKVAEEELVELEAVFGPLDASRWAPLKAAVDTQLFADCSLRLGGGIETLAHRCVLASPEDGHYFSAAFRWPGGGSSATASVVMPEGLSHEALLTLLRLRYGAEEFEADWILEARHFAELFDWPKVRKRCEAHLEALLADSEAVDGASLLAIVTHAEESMAMSPRLKAAALAAAVRQWSKVAEAASNDNTECLTSTKQAELGALNRVRRRDGHVCGSLEEYLHAAADDLTAWERNLPSDAPQKAKKQLEKAWLHWHQILFEFGHIFGASLAEQWRHKIRSRREQLREERTQRQGEQMKLPAGRIWFEATADWREVPGNAICPAGLEYRFDMQTGRNFARLSM